MMMEERQYPDRFSEFLHWLPRPIGSLAVGVIFAVGAFPVLLLITVGHWQASLLFSGAAGIIFATGAHWVRVQYGDFKYPGRKTGRRVGERDAEESE